MVFLDIKVLQIYALDNEIINLFDKNEFYVYGSIQNTLTYFYLQKYTFVVKMAVALIE